MAGLYPNVRNKEKTESKYKRDELTVELDDETPFNMAVNNMKIAR